MNHTMHTFTAAGRGARRVFGALGLAVGLSLVPGLTPAQTTYYIDESTDFTGNGCENADLNDVTSSLQAALNSAGWTGRRFVNANAWPHDFIEASLSGPGGLDSTYADTATLSVYAGHGNVALLQFGFQRNGRCLVDLPNDTWLGTRAGDGAAYAMYVTSCTINLSGIARHFNNQIRQSFGYHNSPSVGDDQPRDFFNATAGTTNAQAWINEMEDRPGWMTGDNSPIVLTFGLDAANCDWVRDTASLRGGRLVDLAPEPHGWYCWIMFDHGGC
ncbi:DUF6345 domain-containing protein [Aquabacterium sp. A7-Y]|uniref:DUF6345 domain-containing protein n=1 Tax=Aquabacterium sp. A7-Y TaxID=1349605 RepID=UPI00223C9EB2|nr:DUF6345 domain-containing protein [Aquabacterium sp. A7-Y]MCW7537953.1 DUF6345 domain-containing protein [Aquabacterium sp. A7-Y]